MKIKVSIKRITEARNYWKGVARRHGWLDRWEAQNCRMAVWVDPKTGEVKDTLYRIDWVKNVKPSSDVILKYGTSEEIKQFDFVV